MKHTKGPWTLDDPIHAHVVDGDYHVIDSGSFRLATFMSEADAKLITAAPELFTMLDELNGLFDQQTYQEQSRLGNDAPDDHEFCVNLTAKQLRAINALLLKAGGAA